MKHLLLFTTLFLFLPSCYRVETGKDEFLLYTIKKGEHSSVSGPYFTNATKVSCQVILDESCIYTISEENQCDTNKLFGLSDAYNHSDHSARFGWRYYNNKIDILTYVRRDGNFYFNVIGSVNPRDTNYYSIEILPDVYRFIFNNTVSDVQRTSQYSGARYRLFPYFGGNEKAPQDIFIKIKYL
jgi:hypothetical protein